MVKLDGDDLELQYRHTLEDTENLPPPEVLASEIVEQLEAALEEFRSVEEVLAGKGEITP